MFWIIVIGLLTGLTIALIVNLEIEARTRKIKAYKTQVSEFFLLMKKLDLPKEDVLDMLLTFKNVKELKKANIKLKKALNNHNL